MYNYFQMIYLSDQRPFASGGHRLCYVHPEDDGKCIKVLRPETQGHLVKNRYRFPRNLRSSKHYDDNQREKRAYVYVDSFKASDVWKHIPHYYGCVETDMGSGGVTQLIRDFDGEISQPLSLRLAQMTTGQLDEPCQASIEEFKTFLCSTLFLFRGLTPHNVLSVRISDKQERLFLIEGFGPPEYIPLVRFIPLLAKNKIKRKFKKFEQRIQAELMEAKSKSD